MQNGICQDLVFFHSLTHTQGVKAPSYNSLVTANLECKHMDTFSLTDSYLVECFNRNIKDTKKIKLDKFIMSCFAFRLLRPLI